MPAFHASTEKTGKRFECTVGNHSAGDEPFFQADGEKSFFSLTGRRISLFRGTKKSPESVAADGQSLRNLASPTGFEPVLSA